jgi:glutathione S-transferase
MILYDYELSADCYAVRLLAALLRLNLDLVPIAFYPAREHESAAFRRINPRGSLPVLVDDDLTLTETGAILTHLAAQADGGSPWLPGDSLAQVIEWLGFAARLGASAGLARLHDGFMFPLDIARARGDAHALFRLLDAHLWFAEAAGRDWLCSGPRPTIADIACFPHVMLAEEGGIERIHYPAIRRWLDRLRGLPGFIGMPGIFVPALAPASPGG